MVRYGSDIIGVFFEKFLFMRLWIINNSNSSCEIHDFAAVLHVMNTINTHATSVSMTPFES